MAPGQPVPECPADEIAQSFTSGFASLLATELGEPAAEARPVAAALPQVFEVPLQRGQAAALAVFVAGGDAGTPPEVWHWRLPDL